MVVILVVLTFVLFLAVGTILERRENRERESARELRHLAQHAVFAQDGGKPVDKETTDNTDKVVKKKIHH